MLDFYFNLCEEEESSLRPLPQQTTVQNSKKKRTLKLFGHDNKINKPVPHIASEPDVTVCKDFLPTFIFFSRYKRVVHYYGVTSITSNDKHTYFLKEN